MRARTRLSQLAVLALLCGCASESAECKQLSALYQDQTKVADEAFSAYVEAVEAAISGSPAGEEACGVEELNPRNHKVVSAGKVRAHGEPGVLGGLRGHKVQSIDCPHEPPERQKELLKNLQSEADALASKHQLLFVESSRVKPKLTDAKTYVPGQVTGRVLVYSFGEKKVVCAAEVTASSGEKLTTLSSGDAAKSLDNQLTFLAVKAGVESLKKTK